MELFTFPNLITLLMLVLLQAVLGFDNLLYISLESKRAPGDRQSYVRKMGIGVAVVLRIILLFLLMNLIAYVQNDLFAFDWSFAKGHFNLHAIIVLFGGAFILYTAVKEIWHMMSPIHDISEGEKESSSVKSVITMIVIMNLVFSFDSILSAMALVSDGHGGGAFSTADIIIMSTAIIIGGILMIWLADRVSDFLQKNRLYEVLGLFVLFIVGVMLITEGGELAELQILGNPIEKMSKTTFYFVIGVLIVIDLVQSKYQKKLLAEKKQLEEIVLHENNDN
ncbi:MAG: putative tellurium resistance membrane protein TerC [Bacteroidia bacterium]|jgi:predicted tellurium resistance membrane protein TerC